MRQVVNLRSIHFICGMVIPFHMKQSIPEEEVCRRITEHSRTPYCPMITIYMILKHGNYMAIYRLNRQRNGGVKRQILKRLHLCFIVLRVGTDTDHKY